MMDDPLDEMFPFDLHVEFYLRHRADPLFCLVRINLHPDFVKAYDVKHLMDLAQNMVLEEIDTMGAHRLVFSDTKETRRIILTSEIQSVSILAPDHLPEGAVVTDASD